MRRLTASTGCTRRRAPSITGRGLSHACARNPFLHINYPKAPDFGNGDIDKIEVQVAWEGEDSAVVTFETYPG
ncbi:hypothetical protein [Streptomyces virginiae]|uniref:hypothetical protein n=1 Tax=Streptomyces virginiae TaxID=1961 RepID=UPI0038640346|nr:hypothetical protein OG253_22205 [Streptomyces virginiae]